MKKIGRIKYEGSNWMIIFEGGITNTNQYVVLFGWDRIKEGQIGLLFETFCKAGAHLIGIIMANFNL